MDDLLAKPEVMVRIQQAEQDLPNDTWKAGGENWPVIRNVSRYERETELADEVIRSLRSRLKELSAPGLVNLLKTRDAGASSSTSGVAYQVYLAGNLAIMKELSSRPRSELESLRSLQNDARVIFGGASGGQLIVGEFIRLRLLNEPP